MNGAMAIAWGRAVHVFCIKNDDLCIKNDEFCIKNDDLCIKNDDLNAVRFSGCGFLH